MGAVQSPGRGLRRFDEHAAKVTRLIEGFRGLEKGTVPSNALTALKRAAPYMGIPLRVVSLVDLLFAWTKPQDWQGGRLPIVWPSNDLLAQKLGVTVRQVQKLLRQAQAHGLIGFVDSPNGHRGGRRGADGFITWAYGIALAPIGTRYDEFAMRAAHGLAQDTALTVLRKRLAAARRKIRTLAQTALDADLHHLKADDDLALARMATDQMRHVRDTALLTKCVEQIEKSAKRLTDALFAEFSASKNPSNEQNSSCWHGINDIHSTTTSQLQSAEADTSSGLPEKSKRSEAALTDQSQIAVDADLEKHGIGPSFIKEIASDLCTDRFYQDETWGAVVAISERLAAQSGIPSHAFKEACRIMGPKGAAASVIATIQKYRRGEVDRPGAYLRGMSNKASNGELNLGRTLHGLKVANRAGAMRAIPDGTDAIPIGSIVPRLVNTRMTMR